MVPSNRPVVSMQVCASSQPRGARPIKRVHARMPVDDSMPLWEAAVNSPVEIRQLNTRVVYRNRWMTVREDEWWDLPEGRRLVQLRERRVVPSELVLMCRVAGLDVLHLWGGTAGAWGRRPLQLAEIEMMVVARKKENE